MGASIARGLLVLSALAGGAAVACGAFGAHALEGQLTVKQTGWWDTATFYLLIHAAVGLALALPAQDDRPFLAGWFIVCGALLFAATLYAMALGAPIWLGAITPVGGAAMIAGWTMIAAFAMRSR